MAESAPRAASGFQLKVWQLAALPVFVAVVILNIQDQRLTDPKLIALAVAGFVLYGVLGWIGWRLIRPFEGRFGRLAVLAAYFSAMAALFLVATGVFLSIELAYFR